MRRAQRLMLLGLLPIYVRLNVAGNRMECSTKKFIDYAKWSPEMSKMKGNSEEARSINRHLIQPLQILLLLQHV
jgi:hypothetical protein|tara:strand:+ start:144 stop:365 length:222 start_codon:yes stop_codon:yes gene_type:complete